ncbi:MAG: flagellar basal body-associated FliL family protein [Candidatus Sumerlaeota bacterium]|nr:flagellar basal body-associated FliL family protein [Candidatus Sumerlaeota bacterium]
MAKELNDAEAAPAPPKASKMPLIIIIVLATLVVGAGGGAAYFYMKAKKASAAAAGKVASEAGTGEPKEGDQGAKPKTEEGHGETAKGSDGHGEKSKGNGSMGTMMKLDKFIVNLAPGSTRKVCSLTMELELKDSKTEEAAKERMAKIRDAVIMYVTTKSDTEITSDMNAVKIELSQRIQAVLGEGTVKGIYITEFLMP